jgi:diketogulonate reductase-like aldo/keto reductase
MRQQPGIVIPLLGARNLAQLQDNLGTLDVRLDDGQMRRLDEVSGIDLGFPHNFLAQDPIRDIVYGGTYDSIDHHRADRL